jgi:hypothetical protein
MSAPNLKLLLGQRIVGAMLKEGEGPASQLFLIFKDGTYTEFYADDRIRMSAGWPGGAKRARAYMASTHKITHEVHLPATTQPAQGPPTLAASPEAAKERQGSDALGMLAGTTKAEFLRIWRADLAPSLKN